MTTPTIPKITFNTITLSRLAIAKPSQQPLTNPFEFPENPCPVNQNLGI